VPHINTNNGLILKPNQVQNCHDNLYYIKVMDWFKREIFGLSDLDILLELRDAHRLLATGTHYFDQDKK
jgi:hypothetical protein